MKKDKNDSDYFLLELTDEIGRVAQQRVWFLGRDRDSGDTVIHWKYKQFCTAVLGGNKDLTKQFFGTKISESINYIVGLKGITLNIVVGYPKTGYTPSMIDGQIVILDVANNTPEANLSFETFEDAKNFILDNDMERAFLQVNKMQSISSGVEKNVVLIQNIIEAGVPAIAGNAVAGSNGAAAPRRAL